MDPVTTLIMTVLGKYASDQGAALAQQAGRAVADVAGKLFAKVMARLKADPGEAKNAERYEKDPQTFEAPVASALDEKLKADPDFAAELKALLAAFDQAQQAAGVSVMNTGSGDVFVGNNAFKVGNNSGSITYGGTHTSTINRSGGTDLNTQGGDVSITGDVVGRDKNTQ